MPSMLLLVALMYAALAHGAFHAGELVVVVGVVVVASVFAFIARPPRRTDLGAPTLAAAALAAWYVVAGLAAGHVAGAGPAVGLLLGAAATIAIARRADAGEREVILTGVLVIGALVSLTGWAGVAFHHAPWAIEDTGLWRAASTITYANATGGFVGALCLVALDRALGARSGPVRAVTLLLATLCGVGLLATASRGALTGFAVGVVVLVTLRRRARLERLIPPALGTVVAFAALLPSMPSGHHARPVIAVAGLVLGAAIAVAPTRLGVAVAVACAVVGVATPGVRHDAAAAWKPISDQRLTTASSDRAHERRAALDLARDHPVAGVGPGNVTLRWSVYYFVPVGFTVHYAHNEYLQVLVESGVVGLAIAAVGIGFVLAEVRRSAKRAPVGGATAGVAAAGVAAALVMLAVHSAGDFLWHVPVVPLTISALLGVLMTDPEPVADSYA